MKNFSAKLFFATLIVLLCTSVLLTGCKSQSGATETELEGTLTEIMAELYAGVEIEFAVYDTEVTADNAEYYLGTADIAFAEAIASEPMISAIAHSVVLVRMEPGADVDAARLKIQESADPTKWICVRVDPEDVMTDSIGDVILLVMSDEAPAFVEAFRALAK